jgi:1-deoxy-D-xylulose-5-phosphate reductoisomerase
MSKKITLLGSTGSIGTQSLDVIRAQGYEVFGLSAHSHVDKILQQIEEFHPRYVCMTDPDAARRLDAELSGRADAPRLLVGPEGLKQLAALDGTDVVLNSVVGIAGLGASLCAIESGHDLALANKESLVTGGHLVTQAVAKHGVKLLPVDSEHSAIFQCLVGERAPVRRLIVTCSGGAFRDFRAEELANVTVEQALRHPQWDMGAKITIDSSTLVNKGFEVIEAHWLFGTPAERISVLLHPQSIIHSMVEFEDGAIKAQLGTPDMRLPISFALLYPDRANRPGERFNFLNHPQLTFAEVDRAKYPALDIAYDCLRRGGTAACTMNGANEVAVAAFLARKCAWLDIVRAIRYALEHAAFVPSPTLADYAEANAEARALAAEFLQLKN